MWTRTALIASLGTLATGCFFTSLHSPRALQKGEASIGIHGAAVILDNGNADPADDPGVAMFVTTGRYGTSVGEFGVNLGNFGAEATYKRELTDPDGASHISVIGGVGAYIWVFLDTSVGLLVGQDLGPVTGYVGYRQHLIQGDFPTGDAIAGVELHITPNVAAVFELNHNFLIASDANDDFDEFFDLPVLSVGLNFGSERRKPRTLTPLPPPAPVIAPLPPPAPVIAPPGAAPPS